MVPHDSKSDLPLSWIFLELRGERPNCSAHTKMNSLLVLLGYRISAGLVSLVLSYLFSQNCIAHELVEKERKTERHIHTQGKCLASREIELSSFPCLVTAKNKK